ncbi:MAG: YdcF family protein [Puia sp.]|nr:YdcF family protein [Puia sp.]
MNTSRPRTKRILEICLALCAGWFTVHIVYACFDGLNDYKGSADIAIVLGNTVFADSSLSPGLKGRVDKAIALYRERRIKRIMVSGGKGEYGIPEGVAMRRYLLEEKIPADRIIEDNRGQNTYMTAVDFLALNDSLHFSSAIAVTSFYHITRTKYIIRKMGFDHVEGVSSDVYFYNDIFGLFRDFFAFYKYVLFYHREGQRS